MKHMLLLPMAFSLLALPQFSFAQKPADPVEPSAVDRAGAAAGQNTVSARRGNKATPPSATTVSGSGTSSAQGAANYFTTSSRGDSIPPVMIRFSAPDAKANATLEEDLFVMARVISRTLERAETDQVNYKLGVPMLLTGSGRSVRPMYLEGLGPLFMIKVNFPLMPPPKAEEKTANPAAADSEWNEARHEVFGGGEAVAEESSSHNSGYNEEQVEALKKELIGALKNAANIRGLRAEEFVSIAVFGQSSSARTKSVTLGGGSAVGSLKASLSLSYDSTDSTGAAKGTVLTLRAKKGDIDAFANGKLDAEAFKAKVAMTAYAGSGAGSTSINSWIQESVGRWRQ